MCIRDSLKTEQYREPGTDRDRCDTCCSRCAGCENGVRIKEWRIWQMVDYADVYKRKYITENMHLNVSKMPVRRIPRSVWSCSTLMISSSTMSFTVPRKEIIWSRSVHRQSFQRSARLTSHSVMVQMFLWYWHKGMIPPVQVHLLMRSSIISSVCGAKTIPVSYTHLDVYKRQRIIFDTVL